MHNNVLNYLDNIVLKKPDKTAFSDGRNSLTFRQIKQTADSIGTYLSKNGIFRKPVVVFMQKSPMEVAAFLGVVSGGCYYVPLDVEMPAERIRQILENVQSPLILCDEHTLPLAVGLEAGNRRAVLYRDLLSCSPDGSALKSIRRRSIDTDPVYIVFTSGSTGIPKGVCACHRSVIDYIEQLSEVLEFDENTIFGNQSPLYFDACLKEIYPTLKFGATTYLIPKKLFSIPIKLVEYLNQYKINTICWVVSALTMVSAFQTFDEIKPEYLKTIAFGSEVFPIKQFKIWREALSDAVFTNLYGPTEGTGMCCYYRVDRDFGEGESIPIGQPFDNCEILLITENGRAADTKKGESGEICIRGTAVTLGYYNDAQRTGESFVQNPLNHAYPEIIYKTGDIGRYNERGELLYLSRKDYQIKHMGHRIELGEIEAAANALEEVKMSACIYNSEKKKITLFFTGDRDKDSLLQSLKEKLPAYMLPKSVIRMEQMPFTPNGKIDRKALANAADFHK